MKPPGKGSPTPDLAGAPAGMPKDAPKFVREAQTILSELEQAVKDVQRHWLLRNAARPTNPPPPKPPSEPIVPEREPLKAPPSAASSTR